MESRFHLHPAAHRAERGLSVSALYNLSGHLSAPFCFDHQGDQHTDPLLVGTEGAHVKDSKAGHTPFDFSFSAILQTA